MQFARRQDACSRSLHPKEKPSKKRMLEFSRRKRKIKKEQDRRLGPTLPKQVL